MNRAQKIVFFGICIITAVASWFILSRPSEKKIVITHPRTIIIETYFERDKEQTPEQFMDIVNSFSRKMEHSGRKVTIKIYSDIQSGGIVGALLITEESY